MGIFAEPEKQEEILNIWQMLAYNMNIFHVTPQQLASKTQKSITLVSRGLKGEPIAIDLSFLRGCVKAFGFGSGRTGKDGSGYSWDQCVKLLKPNPEMPPRGYFWENIDSDIE